jgi:small subunit ribosomal protein S7e
MLIFDRE